MTNRAALFFIVSFFLIYIFAAPCSAAENPGGNGGGHVVFISSEKISAPYSGDVYVFFGTVTVDCEIDGALYLFFSKAVLTENAKIDGGINTLSSEVNYEAHPVSVIKSIFAPAGALFARDDGISRYSDKIPVIIINAFIGAVQFALCFIIYALRKWFVAQGGIALIYEPFRVINGGLSAYAALIALAFIFFLTVVLFPVSILFVVILYVLALIGETSLAVTIGFLTLDYIIKYANIKTKSGGRVHIRTSLIAGLFIIEAAKLIPYINIPFSFVFFPILAAGTAITAFTNVYYRKVFYEPPYIVS